MSRWIPGYEYLEEGRPAPATRRFTSARAVYDVYDEFRRLDVKDAERRTRIKRIYSAFLPYSPEDLRAADPHPTPDKGRFISIKKTERAI